MAYKTISIDIETYELLKARKGPGQSFSEVIRAGFRRGGTGRDLAAAVARSAAVSDEALDAIDRQIAARRRSPARKARF
jgi:predicted CopG family antitoxin